MPVFPHTNKTNNQLPPPPYCGSSLYVTFLTIITTYNNLVLLPLSAIRGPEVIAKARCSKLAGVEGSKDAVLSRDDVRLGAITNESTTMDR